MRPPPKLAPTNQRITKDPSSEGIGAPIDPFAMGPSTCPPPVPPATCVSLSRVCKPRALSWADSSSVCTSQIAGAPAGRLALSASCPTFWARTCAEKQCDGKEPNLLSGCPSVPCPCP